MAFLRTTGFDLELLAAKARSIVRPSSSSRKVDERREAERKASLERVARRGGR